MAVEEVVKEEKLVQPRVEMSAKTDMAEGNQILANGHETEAEEAPVVAPTRAMTRAERLRHADQKLLRHRSTRPAPEKDVRKATVTGVIAALALVAIFQMGAIAVAVLVTAAPSRARGRPAPPPAGR